MIQFLFYHLRKSEVRQKEEDKRDETKHWSTDSGPRGGKNQQGKYTFAVPSFLSNWVSFFFFLGSVYKEYYLRDTDLLSMFKNEEKRESKKSCSRDLGSP